MAEQILLRVRTENRVTMKTATAENIDQIAKEDGIVDGKNERDVTEMTGTSDEPLPTGETTIVLVERTESEIVRTTGHRRHRVGRSLETRLILSH